MAVKLLVFADTHNADPRRLIEAAQGERDAAALFFLGDGEYDAAALEAAFPATPLYVVQGNCDRSVLEPLEGLVPFGGVLFYYTHGHALGVKQDLDRLWWTAHSRGANAALFGHTHVPHYEFLGGIHLFNPGSVTRPRFGAPSYGRVTVQNGTADFEICRFAPA